jgi:hypothetical protein
MNSKQIATYAIVGLLLVAAWELGVFWMKKAHPDWVFDAPPATQPAPQDSTIAPPVQTQPTTSVASTQAGPDSAPATRPAGQLRAEAPTGMSPAAGAVELGSTTKGDKIYAMQVTLTPHGAGIDQVALNQFDRAVKDSRPYVFQEPYEGFLNTTRPLASRWISIDGKQVDLAGVDWAITRGEGPSVTYSVEVVGDEGPVARV